MFRQRGGTWPELEKNLENHKTMLLLVGDSGGMAFEIQQTMERRLKKKYPNIQDMLKVERSPEHDKHDSWGSKTCAYLITLGDFSSNMKAKMLLEREF
jgi:hypothetical protein